tara:strand:- start:558 stop:1013 length:456 start_codon:yes stop_codon:yes gene_type:complete
MAQNRVIYDYSKVIKDIEISTTYIPGIQQVLTTILAFVGSPEEITKIYKKIQSLMEGDKSIELTADENNIYVLLSLIQELKRKAKEQGLSREVPLSDDLLKEITDMSSELIELDRSNTEAVGNFNASYEKLMEKVNDETVDVKFDVKDQSS